MSKLVDAGKEAGGELLGWGRWALGIAAIVIAVCFVTDHLIWNVPHFEADQTAAIAGFLAAYVGLK
jgi:hypothetical protein